jgi:hypothetical protein
MTEHNLGTLYGLIADLEELHQKTNWGGECYHCEIDSMQENDDDYPTAYRSWPCPTMEIVQRHKRAMYHWDYDPDSWGDKPDELVSVSAPIHTDYDQVFRGTKAECEAWIEKQMKCQTEIC